MMRIQLLPTTLYSNRCFDARTHWLNRTNLATWSCRCRARHITTSWNIWLCTINRPETVSQRPRSILRLRRWTTLLWFRKPFAKVSESLRRPSTPSGNLPSSRAWWASSRPAQTPPIRSTSSYRLWILAAGRYAFSSERSPRRVRRRGKNGMVISNCPRTWHSPTVGRWFPKPRARVVRRQVHSILSHRERVSIRHIASHSLLALGLVHAATTLVQRSWDVLRSKGRTTQTMSLWSGTTALSWSSRIA